MHRSFWTADEFANFENADSIQKNSNRWFSKRDFVREGLKLGLAFEQSLGTSPFQMGFIGGTDSHNGTPSDVAEADFNGGHGPEDGSVDRRRKAGVGGWIDGVDLSIGSLAGVWAEENTRASIWDAMKRREGHGAEWLCQGRADGGRDARQRYRSDLYGLCRKNPDGANLDRIQIINGWVDASGGIHEQIIDAAWSGDRAPGADGKLSTVGNTVDLTTAMFTNDIGAATLIGSWTDENFDPSVGVFYYTRAIEIPTPRWSTYDAVRNDLPLVPEVAATIQERAWGSPILYSPK